MYQLLSKKINLFGSIWLLYLLNQSFLSSGVGIPKATILKYFGSKYCVRVLIIVPFPAESRPSKTTTNGFPEFLTISCNFNNSTCIGINSFIYCFLPILDLIGSSEPYINSSSSKSSFGSDSISFLSSKDLRYLSIYFFTFSVLSPDFNNFRSMFLKNSSVISSSFNFVISSSKSSGFKPSSTNTLTNFSIDSPNTFSDSKSQASVSGIKSKVESLSHLTLY